jgi:hypothetical protein
MAGEAELDPFDALLAEVRELRGRVEWLEKNPAKASPDPEHDRDVERAAQRLVERREGMSEERLRILRDIVRATCDPDGYPPRYGGMDVAEGLRDAVVEIDRLRAALVSEWHFHQILRDQVAKVGAKLGHVGGASIGDVDEGVDGLRANLDDAEAAREDAEAERDELRAALASAEGRAWSAALAKADEIVRSNLDAALSDVGDRISDVFERTAEEARGDDGQ